MSKDLTGQNAGLDGGISPNLGGRKHKKPQSIVKTVMQPLIVLVIAEVLLLIGVLVFNNVIGQLNKNSEDILRKQVQNRTNYLNSLMLNWADLSKLADNINSTTANMIKRGEISLDKLDSDSDSCSSLILEITDELITTLYAKRLSGIYVIFNTQNINEISKSDIPDKTGIYIRDMDPASTPSLRNEDLLLGRAPTAVCRALNIANDSCWKPRFTFSDVEAAENYAYFTEPMKAAFAADYIRSASDYGYWGASAVPLMDSKLTAVTYSIPLVLNDGTIYGVLGIDILDSYLLDQLPYSELFDNGMGTYFVLKQRNSFDSFNIATPFLWNGIDFDRQTNVSLKLTKSSDGYTFNHDGITYFASAEPLQLYSNNAPFESDRWAIVGAVPTQELYRFSNRMMLLFILDIAAMLIVGLLGSAIIGRSVSAPIKRLSNEVAQARNINVIPHLSITGIKELDGFSHAFTSLGRDVVSASTRFLRIIHLASVEIGGYEVNVSENTVYVTDNFFTMLGIEGVDMESLTVERFEEITSELMLNSYFSNEPDGSFLYKIVGKDSSERYIRINRTFIDDRRIGVAEDITASTLERLRVQHERDHDLLTGLINRRAFYERADSLFRTPERLRNAALVMLDTDSLKHINDNYGHDYGDKYIRQVAQCLVKYSPSGTICSRVSGDEFYVLFYGYKTNEDVRGVVDSFAAAIKREVFEVSSDKRMPLSVSAGVAWYPGDTTDFKQLMKYADFAMYRVKHGHKGNLEEFDAKAYSEESFMINAKKEFVKLISEERLFYFFQPIISTDDGKIFAYESLMRTDLPALKDPAIIMQIAHQDGRLQDIEDLTWLIAPRLFRELLEQGKVDPDAYLFINSLANQTLSKTVEERFIKEFKDLMPRIVTEITESDMIDSKIIAKKRSIEGCSGLFALDDYGSGYNSERSLLELSPKFIKVDKSIVRNIEASPDKQRIFSNAVTYAHERDMVIIAEGVETMKEMFKVMELGADLLQGYLIGKPQKEPGAIPNHIVNTIKGFRVRE